MIPGEVRVVAPIIERWRYRWFGRLAVSDGTHELVLPMTGSVAQWFQPDERVLLALASDASDPPDFQDFQLWRPVEHGLLPVWPLWQEEARYERRSPLTGAPLATYRLLFREAARETDFLAIVELEQSHYASEHEKVARWTCPEDGSILDANTRPLCPACHRPMRFSEILRSTRASRFLVAELLDRQSYEPAIVGYVRIDPPLPIMHRRLPDGTLVRHIRRLVFPADWLEPTYWPERHVRLLREREPYRDPDERWALAEEQALAQCDTQAARIARVVIHPDYRGEGLGHTLVSTALRWISERRIPEMRRPKVLVETVAKMARYNPFFERAGFRYLWDTASGAQFSFSDSHRMHRHASNSSSRLIRSLASTADNSIDQHSALPNHSLPRSGSITCARCTGGRSISTTSHRNSRQSSALSASSVALSKPLSCAGST